MVRASNEPGDTDSKLSDRRQPLMPRRGERFRPRHGFRQLDLRDCQRNVGDGQPPRREQEHSGEAGYAPTCRERIDRGAPWAPPASGARVFTMFALRHTTAIGLTKSGSGLGPGIDGLAPFAPAQEGRCTREQRRGCPGSGLRNGR